MKVKCTYTQMVQITDLKLTEKNPNKHPAKQIELLAKILAHQGWRHPVVVSKDTGFVRAGHGRIMAAKLNGWTEVPVDFQDFDSIADEYAFMVADNKIQELSEADDNLLQELALEIGPDFDFELFGIEDFKVKGVDTLPPLKEVEFQATQNKCPSCEYTW